VPPSWAQFVVGHHPHEGHDRGLRQGVPHDVKRGGGLRSPLSQEARHGGSARSRHNHTMDGERSSHSGHDDGSTADGDTMAILSSLSSNATLVRRAAASASPCSTTHHQARGSTMMKQAHRQASHYRGLAASTTAAQAHARGGEDADGGLHLHSSSGQGSGSPSRP
jgi:hypothetical protein